MWFARRMAVIARKILLIIGMLSLTSLSLLVLLGEGERGERRRFLLLLLLRLSRLRLLLRSTEFAFAIAHAILIEPFYKHFLRAPFVWFRQDSDVNELPTPTPMLTPTLQPPPSSQEAYGPPYVANPALKQALFEELRDANRCSVDSICACLNRNIDPNTPDRDNNNDRPLHYAAKQANIELMSLLLRYEANVDRTNALGQTPLMVACQGPSRRHVACVDFLVSCGVTKGSLWLQRAAAVHLNIQRSQRAYGRWPTRCWCFQHVL